MTKVRKFIWQGPGNRYKYKSLYLTNWITTNGIFTYTIRYKERADEPERSYPLLSPFEPYFELQGGLGVQAERKFKTWDKAAKAAQADYDDLILGELV